MGRFLAVRISKILINTTEYNTSNAMIKITLVATHYWSAVMITAAVFSLLQLIAELQALALAEQSQS